MEKWPAGLACNIKEGVQTMEAPPQNMESAPNRGLKKPRRLFLPIAPKM